MKKLIPLLLFVASLSHAQNKEEIENCFDTKILIDTLMKDHKEIPIWTGEGDLAYHTLFSNPKTKSWTYVQFNEKIGCIMGAGDKSQLRIPTTNKKKM